MLKAILTGHGEFSVGLRNALEMIAGPQENICAIPFYENEPLERFQESLEKTIQEISGEGSNLLILTDLFGGTPFNNAMLLSNGKENICVLAGTNLPMLLELIGEILIDSPVESAAEALVNAAKVGAVIGQLTIQEEILEEDGI